MRGTWGAAGIHQLPFRCYRNQLSQRRDRVQGLVRLAVDCDRNVLRHGAEHHLAEGAETVFSVCDNHLLHLVPPVLDLVRQLRAFVEHNASSYVQRFPIKTATSGKFQSRAGVFNHFYNGINGGETKQASDAYTWVSHDKIGK